MTHTKKKLTHITLQLCKATNMQYYHNTVLKIPSNMLKTVFYKYTKKGNFLTVCVPLAGEQRGCASGWQSPDS